MANCVSCSAPLPAYADICVYCGGKHDTDFHGVHRYTVSRPVSERICPHCDISLQTINLEFESKFFIERCKQCMGIFFDPGELQALLEKSVTNVFEVDFQRLTSVNQQLYKKNKSIRYLKCPVCSGHMRRTNFANRSGVIIDSCREHGVWLDGGELNQLMEWKKSGGEMLHEQLQRKSENKASSNYSHAISDTIIENHRPNFRWNSRGNDENLIASVSNIVGRLFG